MKPPIVIIGIGEMGGVFARGFLRLGHPVYPVPRDLALEEVAQEVPYPALVLVAVAEADLHPILKQIPGPWQNRLALLQNELLPRDWQPYPFTDLTVISVWFEKKAGQDVKILLPSPAHGPGAPLLASSLKALTIPAQVLTTEAELLFELVRKNVYILTVNIAGLITGGDVTTLWNQHQDLAKRVAKDVLDLQEWLAGTSLPRERLIEGMVAAIEADPQHKCTGRSAPARLERALQLAGEAGLEVATLREIAHQRT
ncbi:conserved hypothetical protein [Nitrosococcus halophilus Nc 4]|uniref:Ketopantoate reductase n=1 Tax=Nitrosococcus halophilus (strain Nc4) TaxID=472759 RepID=D5BZ12_NITHN|nr:hypothetical protein [Nitrosococcus halophilus]ADE14225.1 conserved hypothetical protein [Nitrosococcus halophilus Nc 4]